MSIRDSATAVLANEPSGLEFCYSGGEFHSRLERLIDAAREEILFAFYVFRHDESGRRMVECLRRARQRGVRVRLVFDDLLAPGRHGVRRMMARHGIEARAFRPLYHWLLCHPRKFFCRNHARFFLFDRRIFGTGGFALCERWAERRDFGAFVQLDNADSLLRFFDHLWTTAQSCYAHSAAVEPTRLSAGVDACFSGPGLGASAYDWFCQAIRAARRRVWIQTPFFMPPQGMLRELERARRRGVPVRVITPRQTDRAAYDWLGAPVARLLAGDGVEWRLTSEYFHGKSFLADDLWAFGSSNFDLVSFRRSYELDLVGNGGPIARAVRQEMEQAALHATVRNGSFVWPPWAPGWKVPYRLLEALFSNV